MKNNPLIIFDEPDRGKHSVKNPGGLYGGSVLSPISVSMKGSFMPCKWPLGNGEFLGFDINVKNASFDAVAGLYIFCYKTEDKYWRAVYVGQTDDFSSRIPNHEKWDSARKLGATHVHTFWVPSPVRREEWEQMLIQYLQPPLNED